MWVDPGRDGWRIIEGGTENTLPTQCCEDDDDSPAGVFTPNIYIRVEFNWVPVPVNSFYVKPKYVKQFFINLRQV